MKKLLSYKNGNIVVIILVIVAIIILAIIAFATMNRETPQNNGINDVEWITYRNEEFNFEIEHPSDWAVAEMVDEFTPAFNFYPEGQEINLPLIHHSNAVHVSVFPKGVPTEGVFGETTTSTISFSENTQIALDFILEDSTAWATFATFEETPNSWESFGFVWARAQIENFTTVCLDEEQEIPIEECELMDPEINHQIVYRGEVDERSREIQIHMLESFRFLNNNNS